MYKTSCRNSEPSLSLHYFELVLLNSNLHLYSLVSNFNPELSIFGFFVGLFIHLSFASAVCLWGPLQFKNDLKKFLLIYKANKTHSCYLYYHLD